MTQPSNEVREYFSDDSLRRSASFLRNYRLRTDTDLYPQCLRALSELKQEAVQRNDQRVAKAIWCLETIAKVQEHYITAFQRMCSAEFPAAWRQLAKCEAEATFLGDHFADSEAEFGIGYISLHTDQFQQLFPLGLGTSPELVIEETRCSICDEKITLRNDCGHEPGEIYDGEMCTRVVGKIAAVIGVALVTNPVQRSTMIFPDEDKRERFYPIQRLAQSLGSPWQPWRIHKEERRLHHPAFQALGRNDVCACGSGVKYKLCCLHKDTVFPHYQVYLVGGA